MFHQIKLTGSPPLNSIGSVSMIAVIAACQSVKRQQTPKPTISHHLLSIPRDSSKIHKTNRSIRRKTDTHLPLLLLRQRTPSCNLSPSPHPSRRTNNPPSPRTSHPTPSRRSSPSSSHPNTTGNPTPPRRSGRARVFIYIVVIVCAGMDCGVGLVAHLRLFGMVVLRGRRWLRVGDGWWEGCGGVRGRCCQYLGVNGWG